MKRKDNYPIEVQHPAEAKKTDNTADGLVHQGIPEFEREPYFMPSTPIFLNDRQIAIRNEILRQELRSDGAGGSDPFGLHAARR